MQGPAGLSAKAGGIEIADPPAVESVGILEYAKVGAEQRGATVRRHVPAAQVGDAIDADRRREQRRAGTNPLRSAIPVLGVLVVVEPLRIVNHRGPAERFGVEARSGGGLHPRQKLNQDQDARLVLDAVNTDRAPLKPLSARLESRQRENIE